MPDLASGDIVLERMFRAVERVKERLLKATAALDKAGLHYAVIGGSAVAAWVAKVEEAAVRNTRDVDILVRRSDFDLAKAALERAGFVHRRAMGIELFLDGPDAKARDAVHIVFAGEKVRPEYVSSAPDVSESEAQAPFRLLSLEPLVRMKLTSFRDKDRMHLRDMIDIGLIDNSWPDRFPPELAARLCDLLEHPE